MNKAIEERLRLADEVEKVAEMPLERIREMFVMGAELKVPGGTVSLKEAAESIEKALKVWNETKEMLPPQGITVETKIDDGKGVRNQQRLYRYKNLWFFPDGSMYVYYTPTHWRYCK